MDPSLLAIAYTSPYIGLFDKVTGKSKGTIEVPGAEGPYGQTNEVVVHPSMSLGITGHENKLIRLFDLKSSKRSKLTLF